MSGTERGSGLGRTFDLDETLLDEPFYLLHVWGRQFDPSVVAAFRNVLRKRIA